LSKEYESIKVEKAVYKRLVYVKEVMKERHKDIGITGRVTMSSLINDSLRILESQLERNRK